MKRCLLRLVVLPVLCFLQPVFAYAGSLTLGWDRNTESDVAGYIIYVGQNSGVYTQQIDVGNTTTYTFPTFDESVPHYFAVQAYNTMGLRSGLSSEAALLPSAGGDKDFGGDGTADIVWRHQEGWIALWHMNGTNLASSVLMNPSIVHDTDWEIVATGDMNGDGRPDLTWRHKTLGWNATWIMNGTVLATDVLLAPARVSDTRWKIAASADLDGDRKTDLIWQHETGVVAAWLMNGLEMRESVLLNPSMVPPDTWNIVAAGDLDGDGRSDLLWQHKDGWLSAWFMNGINMREAVLLNPGRVGGTDWKIKGLADFNQDGRLDILWQHTEGWLSAWIMNGITMSDAIYLNPPMVPGGQWQIVGPK